METKILIFLGLTVIAFGCSLIITYIKLFNERKEHKRAKMINEFLFSITKRNSSGPSLNALAKMDIDILEILSYQLGEYYKKNFFSLTTKISIREVNEYVKSINGLPESPQKDFISAILKKELFNQPLERTVVDFIFYTIKIFNSTDRDLYLFEFLFGDTQYLQENKYQITRILNNCKCLFTAIYVEEQIEKNMIDDFDELLKLVK